VAPPYLLITPDNPDGALDQRGVKAFRDGLTADRVAYLDALVTNVFSVDGRTDLVSEPLRAFQVSVASDASPRGTVECTYAFSTTDFRWSRDDRRAHTGHSRGQRRDRATGGQRGAYGGPRQ
jgi:non-heme chloroperoxidase